jgi:ribonuclease HI
MNYIYCDGSTMNNGKPGRKQSGIGAVLLLGGERFTISRSVDDQNNNRTEVKAAVLSLIRALILNPDIANDEMTLYTDSDYFADRYNLILREENYHDLWDVVREVAGMFKKLSVKVVARSAWADTTLHKESHKLAQLGAGATAYQALRSTLPKPIKAANKLKNYAVTVTVPYAKHPTTFHFAARSMRHSISLALPSIPDSTESIEIRIEKP